MKEKQKWLKNDQFWKKVEFKPVLLKNDGVIDRFGIKQECQLEGEGKGKVLNTLRFQHSQREVKYGSEECYQCGCGNMTSLCHVHEDTMYSLLAVDQVPDN